MCLYAVLRHSTVTIEFTVLRSIQCKTFNNPECYCEISIHHAVRSRLSQRSDTNDVQCSPLWSSDEGYAPRTDSTSTPPARRSHRSRRDSDSESDESVARRSLSLASSHSSDEDDLGNGAAPQLRVEQRPPRGPPPAAQREYTDERTWGIIQPQAQSDICMYT